MLCVYKSPRKLNRSTPSKRCCLKRTDAQTDGWKLVQYVRNRNAAVFFFFFFLCIPKNENVCKTDEYDDDHHMMMGSEYMYVQANARERHVL